jgi:hypothetical protein
VPNSSPSETYGKLLWVLDQLAREAARLGDDAISEWTELAQLDAIDLGEQLGLLSDVEAAGRRAGWGRQREAATRTSTNSSDIGFRAAGQITPTQRRSR